MHRLFVALRPPPAIRARLRETIGGVPDARWQDDDQLHLTLRFIGAVERPLAEEIALALGTIAGAAPRVSLAGVGRFERRGRTDALWAGVTPHGPLAALHRKVDRALVRIGLTPERRAYLPHVTIARLSGVAGHGPAIGQWLARHAALASEPFALTHITLYESTLGAGGARYTAIARWPLDPA